MLTKAFEVLDRHTFIPVMATVMDGREDELYIIRAAGFTTLGSKVVVTKLNCLTSEYDPNVWESRTMINAHRFIEDNFYNIPTGHVIDVEYLLGETETKKGSNKNRKLESDI